MDPDPRAAAMEAALDARKALRGTPDLGLVFFGAPFAEAAEAILDAVGEAAGPRHVAGCNGQAIIGGDREIESEPAVSVWLASESDAETFRVELDRTTGGFRGGPRGDGDVILLCDPFSFPADLWLSAIGESHPEVTVMGGLASGGATPGSSRLLHDGDVLEAGAVGISLPAGIGLRPLVSQGCRPVGRALTITKGERNIISELAGRPPVGHIRELYAAADEGDRELISNGLMVGLVIDEYKTDPQRGDFLVRGLLGADPESGAIAVGDAVVPGQTLQFHVRDAASADEDLRAELLAVEGDPAGALLFTCNGRGMRLFGTPHHDAALISDHLGDVAVAGLFCAGEIGPVGPRNFLHGFTASVALFY